MSRTIRRKNAHDIRDYVWESYYKYVDGVFTEVFVEPKSPEFRKRIARYHSDGNKTMNMVSACFRRILNSHFRARQNHDMRVFVKNGDLEEGPILEPHRHNALCLWW